MKKIPFVFTLLIILFIDSIKAQNTLLSLPEANGKVAYESVIDVPGQTKDALYLIAKKWIVSLPDNIITKTLKIDDPNQGELLSSVVMTAKAGDAHWVRFNIQVDCKDNKYRIRLNEMFIVSIFEKDWASPLEIYNDEMKKAKRASIHKNAYILDSEFRNIIASLSDSVYKAQKDDF